jgi:hypothetical protein
MSIQLRALTAVLVLAALASGVAVARFKADASGQQMAAAAKEFLTTLDDAQRSKAALDLAAPERTDWHFIPKDKRKGLQVREMNDVQRKRAHALLESSLSKVGYNKAVKIMELENLLKELEKGKMGTPLRDPERYYFAVFGQPSDNARWTLSIEGHHLSLNFVVDKGQVTSFSPLALCSNPATVMTDAVPSIKKGMRLLASEEQLAFELLESLSADQKKQAVIASEALKEVRAAGEPQPPQTSPEGIAAKELSEKQRELLKQLVSAYLANIPEDVADQRAKLIAGDGWEKVHFAWAGSEKPGVGHYYRVQGPSFLIEFVNTQPDAAGNPANHIHCLWRSMQGDFGLPIDGK